MHSPIVYCLLFTNNSHLHIFTKKLNTHFMKIFTNMYIHTCLFLQPLKKLAMLTNSNSPRVFLFTCFIRYHNNRALPTPPTCTARAVCDASWRRVVWHLRKFTNISNRKAAHYPIPMLSDILNTTSLIPHQKVRCYCHRHCAYTVCLRFVWQGATTCGFVVGFFFAFVLRLFVYVCCGCFLR